jgi:excisionase family DNA binding protein
MGTGEVLTTCTNTHAYRVIETLVVTSCKRFMLLVYVTFSGRKTSPTPHEHLTKTPRTPHALSEKYFLLQLIVYICNHLSLKRIVCICNHFVKLVRTSSQWYTWEKNIVGICHHFRREEDMQGISGDRVLLPTAVACQRTGFSRGYIQRLLKSGRIEGVKLGHDWLIYEDSLSAFLAQPRERGRPKRQSTTSTGQSIAAKETPNENT